MHAFSPPLLHPTCPLTLTQRFLCLQVVFEAEQADIAGAQFSFHDRGLVHEFQMRSVTFYTSKYWYRCLTPERVATVSAADEDTVSTVELKFYSKRFIY